MNGAISLAQVNIIRFFRDPAEKVSLLKLFTSRANLLWYMCALMMHAKSVTKWPPVAPIRILRFWICGFWLMLMILICILNVDLDCNIWLNKWLRFKSEHVWFVCDLHDHQHICPNESNPAHYSSGDSLSMGFTKLLYLNIWLIVFCLVLFLSKGILLLLF